MRATHKRITLVMGSALVAAIVLGGCSGDASDNAAGVSTAQQADGGGAAPEAAKGAAEDSAAEGGAAPGGKDTAAQAPDLRVDQRSIIYRGNLSVRVKDVNAAAGQATGIASTAGGFVGSDNRHSGNGDGSDSATLQLRVPADKFGGVVDQLSKLGDEETREINTEDVTEQIVDLDARLAVQQARVDSGRKLLAQAKSLEDLVMLEREVATRESDLASLQAKKRRLADLTALSTISVTFLDPAAETPAGPDDDPPGFLAGLTGGWNALLGSLKVVLTVLGALLPWLLVIGLPAWGLWWALRRYRHGRAVPAPALAAGPAPAAAGPYAGDPDASEPPAEGSGTKDS